MRNDKKKIKKNGESENLSSLFCVAGEMKKENGEDSFYFSSKENKVILSVFDGCGGIGSRRYGNYSGKTGAYVASRAVCGGVKEWFENTEANPQTLKENIDRVLRICEGYADKGGRLMGSLGKSFPTTAAITIVTEDKSEVAATCLWTGDSRCYMLDLNGLHQLSMDDVDGEDAFSNLSDDGVLKNVITSNVPFTVNRKEFRFNYPCVMFTATDGCFGYVNTPMDFEFLILDSLISSDNIIEWRSNLNSRILEYAGDDYTMSIASFGFGEFDAMRKYFFARYESVKKTFIDSDIPVEEKWMSYKDAYYSFAK